MHLLVGLGNPGREYTQSRHNIGFRAAEEIAARFALSAPRSRFQGLVQEGIVDGDKVIVLKPNTYMNESGRSVGEAARFYKIDPADITVFHDEMDLAAGKVKVKRGGGSAGHNGIRSIDAHIGKDYRRVRIGVGHPGEKGRVHGHVLGNFAKADAKWVDPLLDAIAGAVPDLLRDDDSGFMNQIALATQPRRPHTPKPKTEATAPPADKVAPDDAPAPDKPPADGDTKTTMGQALSSAFSRFRNKE